MKLPIFEQRLADEVLCADPLFSADLVLDGLRHMTILGALQRRAVELDDPMTLVYVDTARELRHERVAARGVSLERIVADEVHPAE